MLIINADDWGRSRGETDAALACFKAGRLTSVSAMVFMEDSERAAGIARQREMDVGLHFNLTEKFSGKSAGSRLQQCLERVARVLRGRELAPLLYHPSVGIDLREIWEAQAAEWERLYGQRPAWVDGHQHMHLAADVVFRDIIPAGVGVRRHFSFFRGEKSFANRLYRNWMDRRLARRYRLTEYFFCLLQSMRMQTLDRVCELARHSCVELMTHPARQREFDYLMSAPATGLWPGVTLGTREQIG